MIIVQLSKFVIGYLIGANFKVTNTDLFTFLIGFLASFSVIYFVYASNALIDEKIDKKNKYKKNRPLASGNANRSVVKFLIIFTFFVSLVTASRISKYFLACILSVAIVGTIYNFSRRNYILTGIVFFITSGVLSFLSGYLCVSSSITNDFVYFLLLNGIYYSTHIFLKDFFDIDVDKKAGYITLPMVLDHSGVRKFLLVCEIIYSFLLIYSYLMFKKLYFISLFPIIFYFFIIQKKLYKRDYKSSYFAFLLATPTILFINLLIFAITNL